MIGSRSKLVLGAAAGAALLGAIAGASAQERVQVGTLQCNVSGSVGLIITQKKSLACNLVNPRGRVVDRYVGQIRDYGIALGATDRGYLSWTVLAAKQGPARGALAGEYIGATANASAGVGGGANLLVGGSERSIALQPLSVQGQTGINIAAGVSSLQLLEMPGR